MSQVMRLLKILAALLLLFITWAVDVLHLGVFTPPPITAASYSRSPQKGEWIDKSRFGAHQLILYGSPYERGLESGRLTHDLMYREENELIQKLRSFIPSTFVFAAFEIAAMRWFWGLDAFLEPSMREELYGVSKAANSIFDSYADPFTRQIAYHGIHEVGQLAVDQGADDMGCTVVALPFRDGFVIGRNFDFEASRIFDSEKILKWVFPDVGFAFVSVIWAGMVGGVTGVNENGVYLSMNAAGSMDFRRLGTPSTLVLVKALQNSKTAKDAVQIIRDATMFITDIFIVADRKSAYRVEKSPRRTEVLPLTKATIVTNHLIAATWKDDAVNEYRKNELTSAQRALRGDQLLKSFPDTRTLNADLVEDLALSVLRDKGEAKGRPLNFGNRQAIDALIATHSVVYNPQGGVLFVSNGPSASGSYTGYDLAASFATRTPVAGRTLTRDPLVSDSLYMKVKKAAHDVSNAESALAEGACDLGWQFLGKTHSQFTEFSAYYSALGDFYQCKKDHENALEFWKRALMLNPAYPKQVRILKEKIKS